MASTNRRETGDEPPSKRQDTGKKKGTSKKPPMMTDVIYDLSVRVYGEAEI
jgi:hypothetical protein